MHNFLKRNAPVLIIGLITALVFIAIAILSNMKPTTGPKLEEVKTAKGTNDIFQVEQKDFGGFGETATSVPSITPTPTPTPVPSMSPDEMDTKYGAIVITYTADGFVPEDAEAYSGQIVRWKNATNTDIAIKQTTFFFDEFKTPKVVPAGGAMDFRIYQKKLWTYKEATTQQYGSIFIRELGTPLIKDPELEPSFVPVK